MFFLHWLLPNTRFSVEKKSVFPFYLYNNWKKIKTIFHTLIVDLPWCPGFNIANTNQQHQNNPIPNFHYHKSLEQKSPISKNATQLGLRDSNCSPAIIAALKVCAYKYYEFMYIFRDDFIWRYIYNRILLLFQTRANIHSMNYRKLANHRLPRHIGESW